ncbi:ImmA/IrrE family metallo-endopeptidase [Nocardioides sp. cx-169]|jgi:Zn-dependent peptidase ImmA (M78 family)|uniref:ImmA/IrrE family metallo-endopeptidase n=1 Tax=Nocardioides sp. cx-169 TaxID=2899080 RepID=UPI001E4E7A30|nr:ImmA/IrrE family metallo-endopeptidase [Nocardioides sp. cx-169]MCD4533552.1 ImmA/IrrE family metallo-endopeptidase [Nocardioides sp. cx-169]
MVLPSAPFNPARLKLARLRLGWSLTKLAEESSVSLRSLTEYETDKRPPSEENLTKLADALDVPAGFFHREAIDLVPVEAASFRKLSKATVGRRNAVLASASLALELYREIDDRFELPVADVPTHDKLSPSQAADLVRNQWNLGDRPISNMVHLLESKGVRLSALNHEYGDIDAFCFYRDGVPYAFLNTGKTGERQRFDLAHELGHLVLHSDFEMDLSTSKQREAEAQEFASAFLMPATAVRSQSMSGATIERILRARSYWKVSAMALTHRLHELELLSDWQYRSTCITLSERGYRKQEPGGIVPETSQLLRKVMYGTDASLKVREVAAALDLNAGEVRNFMRHLVPMTA